MRMTYKITYWTVQNIPEGGSSSESRPLPPANRGVSPSPLCTSATTGPITSTPSGKRVWSSRNENWEGKPNYSEETCSSATSSITNPTWPDLGLNSGCHDGRPGTVWATALSIRQSLDSVFNIRKEPESRWTHKPHLPWGWHALRDVLVKEWFYFGLKFSVKECAGQWQACDAAQSTYLHPGKTTASGLTKATK
jgi:hypothetical protein